MNEIEFVNQVLFWRKQDDEDWTPPDDRTPQTKPKSKANKKSGKHKTAAKRRRLSAR